MSSNVLVKVFSLLKASRNLARPAASRTASASSEQEAASGDGGQRQDRLSSDSRSTLDLLASRSAKEEVQLAQVLPCFVSLPLSILIPDIVNIPRG